MCFSSAVADFVVYDEVRSKLCLEDIPNCSVREQLKNISIHADKVSILLYVLPI